MTEPIPDSEFVEPPLFATADDVQFWEPWTANSPLMRPTPAGSFVSRADFDRLRDERDRLAERLREMIAVYDRHSRWCGYYAQAPGDSIIQRVPAARSALAVFDTLTEEKT